MEIKNVPFGKYRFYEGPKGIGGWTTKPDNDGWYFSFFCKRAGKGARAGGGTHFEYVPRLTTKRRIKQKCIDRSHNLAYGEPITAGIRTAGKGNPSGLTAPGTGYCMAEKKSVIVKDPVMIRAKNDRVMIQGTCPDCGCKIQKYGKIIECPECGESREAKSDDYICRWCREASS